MVNTNVCVCFYRALSACMNAAVIEKSTSARSHPLCKISSIPIPIRSQPHRPGLIHLAWSLSIPTRSQPHRLDLIHLHTAGVGNMESFILMKQFSKLIFEYFWVTLMPLFVSTELYLLAWMWRWLRNPHRQDLIHLARSLPSRSRLDLNHIGQVSSTWHVPYPSRLDLNHIG